MTLGERIVSIRKQQNLTQKDLAEKLGISPTRLNYWEKDKRNPPIPMLNKISEVLRVDGDYLIGRLPESTKESSKPDKTNLEDIEEWLTDLLVSGGYIHTGEDISNRDAAFLLNWIGVLDAWFDKNR